ncbi:hypothetical protein XELAEV_18005640mg [Xenopus laevis]|uniref:Uncharacterized protein n=1 Tax=Xenopus laevis TaxID=8355 RepID=A0A974I2T7_XENLA|nr:hypothetical protein XELAEV_18005640mg [Xenopus laevis]
MADNIDSLLARIRMEAERRGDDWLRQRRNSHSSRRHRLRTVPPRSPQAVTACGKGSGLPRASGRDSRLTEERRNTPAAGPSMAQRGSRRSRQPSGRGRGTAREIGRGDSRHPQLSAEGQLQQLTEEERETSVHLGSQASNDRDAVAAGIGREHAQWQQTGRRDIPSEQGGALTHQGGPKCKSKEGFLCGGPGNE